jgi:hypothetical protein
MTHATDKRSTRDTSGEDLLNEEFHALLREAADKREGRARVQSTEDAAAAAEESRALFALARGQMKLRPVKLRPGPAHNG